MATYDLGQVVGSKGEDGAVIWNTSTAPTYANSKYTFTISNLNGRTGVTIAVGDIIFYDTYYYIVSAKATTTVDCTTRVSIKGSDASVTIVDNLTSDSSTSVLSAKQGKVLNTNKIETSAIATSFGSTTSDSKVPSEKLVKTELDKKIATSNTAGLVKNDGTIDTNTYITSASLPTKTSDLTNDGSSSSDSLVYVETSATNGLIKNDGTVDTNTYSTTSHTHGNLTNDGKVGTNANYFVYTTTSGAITSKQKIGNITTAGKIGSTANLPIITGSSGTLTTGSFGTSANTFAEGNHTHTGMLTSSDIADNLTTDDATKVLSAKQGKALNDLIGAAITYINQ